MNWEETLQLKGKLEKAIKERCMIFQVSAKEEAAQAFNKPIDFYYHLPYSEWCEVSKQLVLKRDKVCVECVKRGIPGNMPFSEFPYYREQMGLTD